MGTVRFSALLRLGLGSVFALGATSAAAQEPAPTTPPVDPAAPLSAPTAPPDPSSDASLTSTPGPKSPLKEPDKTHPHYWAIGEARPFFSTSIDVGYLYFRPRVSVGYGRPFRSWVGIDANPQVSTYFAGGYAGLRFALPLVDLRIGPRYVFAWQHHFLRERPTYGRLEFESQQEARSKYLALEAELTGAIPAGPGSILGVASASYLTGVPAGMNVYEETLRVIAKPPWIWRGRTGYAVRLGVEGRISIGLVGEVVGNPGRDLYMFRAGAVGSAALSNHIEVLGSLLLPIVTPDTLGIFGGEFAQLGVRYRWATGQAKDIPVEQMEE